MDWGKGYASEAAQRLLAFAFENFTAHRIVAFCHAENTTSVRVMQKIGMKQEACVRQVRYYNNRYYDSVKYGILRDEWNNLNK